MCSSNWLARIAHQRRKRRQAQAQRTWLAFVRLSSMHASRSFHGEWYSCSSSRPSGDTGGSQVARVAGGDSERTRGSSHLIVAGPDLRATAALSRERCVACAECLQAAVRSNKLTRGC